MGFRICDSGRVLLDHSIDAYGITCPTRNPRLAVIDNLKVHSVFSRKFNLPKTPDERHGDNCPFIYAYKRKDPNLSIGYTCAKDMKIASEKILGTLLAEDANQFDTLIPMPSKHQLVRHLGKLANRSSQNSAVQETVFRKALLDDVEEQLLDKNIPNPAKEHIKNVIQWGRKAGVEFSLSNVRTKFRKFISPLFLERGIEGNPANVLLLDDLACTGQTLVAARNLLVGLNPCLRVEAVVLFRPHGGRFKPKHK